MGLLIEFVAAVVGAFTAIYTVVAAGSILVGFIQFLIELPNALRQDIDRWHTTHAPPPRLIRYVRNEAENDKDASGPSRALPPHDDGT